ncbi:carboxypeptidase-like regulatory domain-containing protein [Arachidicoccus ginsenosidivorans]
MVADSMGHFLIKHIPVGRYNILCSAVGYESIILENIIVSSVKQPELSVVLNEKVGQLDDIVIQTSSRSGAGDNMAISSSSQLTPEQASRFAGGFDDPARLVASFAGVSSSVSSNGIVVRGNSPNSLQWKMEGIEIPNPNHFADLDGFGGGALTALSSRLLSSADFLTGAFPAPYNNALSGVFDVHMRTGSNKQRVSMVGLGLIGLDLSSEGPFKKSGNSSYLFNYRYSTLGLIGPIIGNNAGVNFQDLSFKLNFPSRKAGTFSLWGIGLLDHSGDKPKKDRNKWEYQDDQEKTDVKQYMGTLGLTHEMPFSNKFILKTTLAATSSGIHLKSDSLDKQNVFIPEDRIKNCYTNFVLSSSLRTKFNARHTNQTGFTITQMEYNLLMRTQPVLNAPLKTIADAKGSSTLLSAYTQSTLNLANRWTMNAGVNGQVFMLNHQYTIEPRLAFKYSVDDRQFFTLAYGLHSRLDRISNYFVKGGLNNDLVNKSLDFTKAHHFVLGFDKSLSAALHFKLEAYYQYLFDVPVIKDSSFSLINLEDDWFFDAPLQNTGKGKNYGVDLTLEKNMTRGFYWMFTSSVFKSKYMGGDNTWRDTRYDRNYVFNLLAGKEWQLGKYKQKSLGVNGRISYQGGDHYSPLDMAASLSQREAVFNEHEAFTRQYDPALTTHLTINYKINRKKSTHEISLKIINANGYREHFGFAYNYLNQKIEDYREALVIPNLSYTITF